MPKTTRDLLTGREYLRVSHDASGRERSNDEQHTENLEVCPTEGLEITGKPYRDRARASRTSKAARAGFDELVADLDAGTFTEDALVLWESSRGSRRVGEWATLLDLLEDRSKRVFVTTHRRLYNPANPRDRRTLLEDAVDAEYESGKSSMRIKRSMRANAMAGGKHGGRRPFGYRSEGGEIEPAEAAVILECVDRVIAGQSVRSIAADLNARGITTSAGNVWRPNVLASVLSGPRIVGLRTHEGVVVAKGQWDAIIDEPTHKRLLAALATRTPTGRRGRTPWLLTGLLRCELCEELLVGNTSSSGSGQAGMRRYQCRKGPGYRGCGGLGIKAAELEELLGDRVTLRLRDVLARKAATPGPGDDAELAELDEIAVLRAEAQELRAAGLLDRDDYAGQLAALKRRQAEVDGRIAAKLREAPAVLDLVAGQGGRPWAELELEEQRDRLRALIEHVTIGPAVRGRNYFDEARVLEPRADGEDRIAWRL